APLLPLPIGGRWLDAIVGRRHRLALAPGDSAALRWLLRRAVGKGETFIYFGDEDPWPEAGLHRIDLGRTRLGSVPKLTPGEPRHIPDDVCALETVWFGVACYVAVGKQRQPALDKLIEFLWLRWHTRASAARSVYVAWSCDAPMPAEALAELQHL